MDLTLEQVAELAGGELHGDPNHVVRGVCALSEAGDAARDHVAFLGAKGDWKDVQASRVTTVLVAGIDGDADRNLVVVADPYLACARVAQHFHPLPRATELRVHPTAAVAEDAALASPVDIGPHAVVEAGVRIGAGTVIGAGAFVGAGSTIGEDCILYPNCTLYHGTVLGDRVRIHSGAVLGADGFGNAKDGATWIRFPQIGNVVIEDDVEIGACTTIDRATFGSTRVGRGSRIDNLVMIAHNCEIGEDVALAGQVGLAGSTKVGDRVQMAGQVGLAGHVEVCSDVVLGAKAGVIASIDRPGFYVGQPAIDANDHLRSLVELRRIGELRREVRRLRKAVEG